MRNRARLYNLVGGSPRFETIHNEHGTTGPAKLYLYDEISYWGVTAADFVAELSMLGNQDVDLHVNSPGGDVFDGLAILNTLRAYSGRVVAYVDGIAASAASFIVMGADEVVMQPNTELMIHDAWGMCLGNSADMRDMAERLDKVSDNIASIYARRGSDDTATWRERMRAEMWLSPEEAVEYGLADRVGGGVDNASATLAFDLTKLRNKKSDDKSATRQPIAAKIKDESEFEWFTTADLMGAFEEAL